MTAREADIAIAALAEVGYQARLGPNGKARVPLGALPPCDAAWRACCLARTSTGRQLQTHAEWHTTNPRYPTSCEDR